MYALYLNRESPFNTNLFSYTVFILFILIIHAA